MGRAPGLATFTVALAAVGCGGTETAAPAADGGAGGGAAVEGCVEIRVDESVLPEPSDWSWGAFVPRHPFWRGQGALHVAWMNFRTNKSQVSLIVSSFEPATGEHLGSRVYDVVPAGLEPWYASIQDAAGAPDGSFAIVFFYRDGGAGGKTVLRVALGNVASESLSAVWTPPWSVSEAMTFDVGWDGEAFAVHAVKQQGSEVRLVRLAPDGSVVTPETEVGTITDIGDWYSAFVTDAETGRTWMATSYKGGVWLSGHERDGTPLVGPESYGGVVIVPQNAQPDSTGGFYPAVAAKGAGALLAWHASVGFGETQLQRVDGTVLVGDAIVIADATPGGRAEKALAHVGDRWWMGVQHVGVAVESFWLSDAAVLSQDVLVPYPSCGEDCVVGIDVPNLLAVTWQDDLWFGFWDYTESSVLPYRIVRVKEGCVYLPMYDAVKQR